MSKQLDDLEAARTLIETLEKFNATDQERIIRWAKEKLGLTLTETPKAHAPTVQATTPIHKDVTAQSSKSVDIKTFVSSKNPTTDRQFATTIAYYYRFEAPIDQRKDSITADDLQDACRKVGRKRFKTPAQTLLNTHNAGLLDKATRGAYSINTIGENLVAMTLPGSKKNIKQTKQVKRKAKVTKKNK
jgi:hypothetical protein